MDANTFKHVMLEQSKYLEKRALEDNISIIEAIEKYSADYRVSFESRKNKKLFPTMQLIYKGREQAC